MRAPQSSEVLPSAMAAFLRGVQRQALAIAELQSGNLAAGYATVTQAFAEFTLSAQKLPLPRWMERFWQVFLRVPVPTLPASSSSWPPGLEHLANIRLSDRQALLFRVVVGIDEAAAIAIFRQTSSAYRQALSRACPRDAQQQPDPAGWRSLAEAAHAYAQALPSSRMQGLLNVAVEVYQRRIHHPNTVRRRRYILRWIVVLAVVTCLCCGVVFWLHHAPAQHISSPSSERILVQPLAPPKQESNNSPVYVDPNVRKIQADPDIAVIHSAGFMSWYADGALATSAAKDE